MSRAFLSLRHFARSAVTKEHQGALSIGAREHQEEGKDWSNKRTRAFFAGGCAIGLAGLTLSEEDEKERKMFATDSITMKEFTDISTETRLRKNHSLDKLFDHFSSYQMVDCKGK